MTASFAEPLDSEPTSHIQRLPPELLEHIFYVYCGISLPIGFHTIRSTDWKPSQPSESNFRALDLTQVCSRWRVIALSNPTLWSRIELRRQLESVTDKTIASFLSIAKLYLGRSGQLPLDLVVEFTDTFFQQNEHLEISIELDDICRRFLPIYGLFFDQAHRWRNTHLFIPRHGLFEPNWGIHLDWPVHFPIMEELVVHVMCSANERFDLDPTVTILSAPRLHTLTQTGHEFMIAGRTFTDVSTAADAYSSDPLSFDSLRSLTFSQTLDARSFCLASPLTTVTIRQIREFVFSARKTCLAKNLVIFSEPRKPLHWTVQNVLRHMAQVITYPNLVSFSLEYPITLFPDLALAPPKASSDSEYVLKTDPAPEPHPSLILHANLLIFLSQSTSMGITHFSIINIRLKDDHLVQVLSQLPSLSHLALADTVFRDYRDSGDYRAGAHNDIELEKAEHEWRLQGRTLMFSRWFFRSLSFPDPSHTRDIPNLAEFHVGFSRGQSLGVILAFLDMVESRRPHKSGLKFVRMTLVSDRNRDCSDSESYYGSDEYLPLEEHVDRAVKERLDQLREVGMMVELRWADTLREWRAGIGCWEIDTD
ncbi:hypothetical protein VKT23_012629 [Stygiomarasmius scandens]|uniref:F-box domain-containing protein n=1 Tax=Marasmiellus scandens TaxID=2682957 RepID=A0ABR1J660_9AGAR